MPAPKGVRSFVAVDLPADLRARLRDLGQELERRSPPGSVRWARPEGIHLTLKFLGDVPAAELPPISEFLAGAARRSPAFRVSVAGLGCFPNVRRPRIVWVGVEDSTGALRRLQAEIEAGLERLGHPKEDRPFSPHLTLGRLRQEAGGAAPDVGAAVESSPVPSLGEIPVQTVCLFRSDLRPGGAVYSVQGQFPLEGQT